jgi:hypothetical protein
MSFVCRFLGESFCRYLTLTLHLVKPSFERKNISP